MSIKLTVLLLASVCMPLLQGARIKIPIRLPDDYIQQRVSRQTGFIACSDKVIVGIETHWHFLEC